VIATLLASWLAGVSALLGTTTEPAPPPCFSAWATPIYQGVGWTHFVDVANDCPVEIACEVATTVDPSPMYPTRVLPAEVVRVRTRYGSVTPEFDAIVRCWPAPDDTNAP
jgi:hypothetical protein